MRLTFYVLFKKITQINILYTLKVPQTFVLFNIKMYQKDETNNKATKKHFSKHKNKQNTAFIFHKIFLLLTFSTFI